MEDIGRVDRFCYLGDVINSGGGCEIAVARRSRFGWIKFNELASILCGRRFTMKMKGKIYKACVRSVMVYGAETWNGKDNRRGDFEKNRKSDGEKDVWC